MFVDYMKIAGKVAGQNRPQQVNMITDRNIQRVANMLNMSISLPEIRKILVKDGASEEEVYLLYHAGRNLANG